MGAIVRCGLEPTSSPTSISTSNTPNYRVSSGAFRVGYTIAMSNTQEIKLEKLRKLNIFAGVLHFVSLIAVLALSNDFALPVTATYQTGPPGTTFTDAVVLFNLNVSYMVAAFLGLSAFFHFFISYGYNFKRYAAGLLKHINVFRWVEYSLSSSVMIILIAMITGISGYAALLAIFAANLSMILFGWLQEKYAEPGDKQWLPFIFGCIAGIVPWIIVLVQLIAPGNPSDTTPPGFVYGIVFSIFVLFNSFAIVQFLQYRAKGKWRNYLRGEKTYIVLSFVAKSLLAWQIFANTLVP